MSRQTDRYRGSASYRRRRSRRKSNAPLLGLILLILIAVACGVVVYQMAKASLGERPDVKHPVSTPVPTGTPELTPDLTPDLTPEPTPTLTPEPTPTPTPEPTLPPDVTPTPTPSPSPRPTAVPTPWDEGYLEGFIDTREPVTVRGAYTGLSLYDSEKLQSWLELADTTELNAVVIDIKADSGRVTYQMSSSLVQETGACISHFKDIKALLSTLKEHGIYTIARVVCFRDAYIGKVHPEWLLRTKDGELYKDDKDMNWINPYNEEAWEYVLAVAEQAVLDGFDEICFDYIRSSTIKRDTIDYGAAAETMTLQEAVTEFTKRACNRLKPLGAFVSASVYGTVIRSDVDARNIGQNYLEMSRYLDYICPMVYPSHYALGYAGFSVPDAVPYELILFEMKASAKKLAPLADQQATYADVRPWLQAFTASYLGKGKYITYTGDVVRKQIDATYDAGYTGWTLWNAGAKYVDGCFLPDDE